MRSVWVVLRREYLERVRTKGFIISTLAVPLIIMGLMALSIFLGVRSEQSEREMALLDLTGTLGEQVAAELGRLGYSIELVDPSEGTETLDQRVEDNELRAYLVLDDLTTSEGAFVYRSKDTPGRLFRALAQRIVGETVLDARLANTEDPAGLRQLLGGGELEFEALDEEAADNEVADRVVPMITGFAGAMLLYMTILIYGAYVLRSVMEEKRNRVVEIVISSIRPWELMLGKIVGVGAVGLTQLGIWVLFVSLLGLLAVPAVLASVPAANLSDLGAVLPGPGVLLLFLLFFVLGYFLYSALFATVGAMCSRDEDAQQAQFPVVMLLVVPLVLQMSSINGRGMAWIDWLALFPFFSPILMYPRAAAGAVPAWMVIASLVLMVLAVIATAWVAGRIYRVGILMQGKRPTLKELVRWVRAA